jgi:hypothetical protein
MDSMDWLVVIKTMQEAMLKEHRKHESGLYALNTPCQHPKCRQMGGLIEEVHAAFIRPGGSYPRDVIADLKMSLRMVNSALQVMVMDLAENKLLRPDYKEELLERLTEADTRCL